MKTASLTLPTHRFIDTAPLEGRYDVLAKAVLVFVVAGRLGQAIQATHKVIRLVRILTKLEAHNVHLKRKLDMLSHKPWRDCVLRELGGMRTLKLWEAAYKRILARRSAPAKPAAPQEPAWLYTAERRAESERLKAWARDCSRAGHNPLIMRERCKVDGEGEFRLAPLPRGERAGRRATVYTQETISDYDWNPMPLAEEKGFGPACVWPSEFYAAIAIEAEILEERETALSSVIPDESSEENSEGPYDTREEDEERDEDAPDESVRGQHHAYTVLQPLTLKAVLPTKTYRDLF